jgi:hypothetical protein
MSYYGRPITKYYETLDTHPKIEVCSLHLELYWFPLACLDGSESSTLGKGYGISWGTNWELEKCVRNTFEIW